MADTASTIEGETQVKLRWLRLNNPEIQNLIAGACLCFNPGFYNALVLLGAGGGQASSATMSNTANAILYGVFTFAAIGASSLLNRFGPRITLMIGCTGYPIFNGAMWYFTRTGHMWFPIFAGAYLGISAGCLWTTAVTISNGYPEEKDKARWRAIQWIFNMSGSAIGACVALGISWDKNARRVPWSVYIVFITLQCCSLFFAALALSPDKLRRPDGTALAHFPRISTVESLRATFDLLKEHKILIMLPCMFIPEMFYPFQSTINSYTFNLRTRTLNSLLFPLIQVPTTGLIAWILDCERLGSRKKRAALGVTVCAVWVTGTYIALTAWLAAWNFDLSVEGPHIDCTDPAYRGAVVIYVMYAAQFGMVQSTVIYILGTFTNDPRKNATIGGLYIGNLSAGTAVSFGLCAAGVRFQNIAGALFALSTLMWPILYFVVYKYTTNTNYGTETVVIPPVHVQEELGLERKDDENQNINKTGSRVRNDAKETLG